MDMLADAIMYFVQFSTDSCHSLNYIPTTNHGLQNMSRGITSNSDSLTLIKDADDLAFVACLSDKPSLNFLVQCYFPQAKCQEDQRAVSRRQPNKWLTTPTLHAARINATGGKAGFKF